jgi:glutamate-1-semialdehyde 2,1-aminomutase
MRRDHTRLAEHLLAEYERRFPRSAALDRRGSAVMVDGGSHGVRLNRPFPVRISGAHGAYLRDVDGHDILDYWQGHFANILGHAPAVVTRALVESLDSGRGLQLGMTDELQIETAELLSNAVHAEKLRFTTSGTLATMYATMLARAFTGRDLVLKAAGGWHGAQPWGLKGVYYLPGPEHWGPDSEGLPARVTDEVRITLFNDADELTGQFRRHGDRIACLIVEPFAGAGNFQAAIPEYLAAARELCERHGALLVFDEVITGFRFRAGDLGSLYGIRPDLVALGKVLGGGMPVAAVAGRGDVMALCGREGGFRVAFLGGTFSAHPASLLAARTMVAHLVEHEAEIYPRLAALGDRMRRSITEAFAAEGIAVQCTGGPDEVLPGSSVTGIHFPYDPDTVVDRPHVAHDPSLCDTALNEELLQLALLLEDVYQNYSCPTLSTAHTEADVDRLAEACGAAARRIKRHL